MQERNEISVELSAISALVGGISRQTPYRVPVGYFDQFPDAMMRRIGAKSATFQVPEGYFDGLAAQVLGRIKADAPTANVDEDKVSILEAELPPIFKQISRITPYQVPGDYWEELSPLLAVLLDKPAYAIPEGYFEALAGQILESLTPAKVAEVTPARVIPMEPVVAGNREAGRRGEAKVLKGNWWKYTSVASIAACLLLIFSWPQTEKKMGEGNATVLISQGLQKVSDQDMQTYLDDQHTLLTDPLDKSTATLDMNEGDVKLVLGDVSDKDLQLYMEEHGKADDLATN